MKINRFIIWLCLLLVSATAQSQSIEQLFKDKTNCAEIELLALEAIPKYHANEQLDSIELVLDFVSYKCLENASLRIARFLLLIDQNRFSDTILSPLDLYYIKKESQHLKKNNLFDYFFRQSSLFEASPNETADVFWRRDAIEARFLEMLFNWSQDLARRNNTDPLQKAVLHHLQPPDEERITSNGLWALGAKRHGYLSLPSTYDKYHSDYVIRRSWQLTVGAGQFVSTGAMRPLMGSRASFMFSIGKNFGNLKNRIDFGGNFTFGNTRTSYKVVRPDTSFTANDGYASFAYLDYVRNLWRPNRFFEWNVSLGGGIAEKGIYRALSEDETIENEPAEISNRKMGKSFIVKPAVFAGTEFKVFFASGAAFNLQARYNFFNWGTIGGVPFGGNVITMYAGLSFHFGGHPNRGANNLWNMLD